MADPRFLSTFYKKIKNRKKFIDITINSINIAAFIFLFFIHKILECFVFIIRKRLLYDCYNYYTLYSNTMQLSKSHLSIIVIVIITAVVVIIYRTCNVIDISLSSRNFNFVSWRTIFPSFHGEHFHFLFET